MSPKEMVWLVLSLLLRELKLFLQLTHETRLNACQLRLANDPVGQSAQNFSGEQSQQGISASFFAQPT